MLNLKMELQQSNLSQNIFGEVVHRPIQYLKVFKGQVTDF